MRKDNTIFFLAGLGFGVLLGYFTFQAVERRPPADRVAESSLSSGEEQAPARRLLDPKEMAALEQMAERTPEDGALRSQIGNLYMEAGRYEEAVSSFREALAIKGKDLHLRNHLALSLENLGRTDEALAEYEAALAIDSSHPESLLGLGRVKLYGKRDIRGGIEAWEKLLQVAPASTAARSVREELEALKSAHPGG